jgi:arginase family enzyme
VEGAVSTRLVGLRCRTSDRSAGGARGVEVLTEALATAHGLEPRLVGSPSPPRDDRWDAALRDARGCILEAGGQVSDALRDGDFPLLVAAECSIAMATLPAVMRERPDAKILWLDAHGDFNTPDTTQSGYLGGMPLAGACGMWDTGFDGPEVATDRVVLAGVRDVDDAERKLLAETRARVIGSSSATPQRTRLALDGAPVFVHLDVDVLDPTALAAVKFPTPGGLSAAALADLLEMVAEASEVIGVEVTAFDAPEDPVEAAGPAGHIAQTVAALLPPSAG